MDWIGEYASGIRCSIYKWSCWAEWSKPSDYSSYDIFQHSSQPMPIGDSTLTSRWPRTGRFVRTCRGTVLQYVENKVPLALKRCVAAHRFLNKICFNEGYLSGPKGCWSNLETPCILWPYNTRGLMLLKFPDICLRVDEKLRKKPQPGNWPNWVGYRTRARCQKSNNVIPRPQRWSFFFLLYGTTSWFDLGIIFCKII